MFNENCNCQSCLNERYGRSSQDSAAQNFYGQQLGAFSGSHAKPHVEPYRSVELQQLEATKELTKAVNSLVVTLAKYMNRDQS